MIDKVFLLFIRWLIPPKVNASPEEQYAWRIGIVSIIIIIGGALALHLAWAAGLAPFSEKGYSTVSELTILTAEVRGYRISQLTTNLLDLQTRRCKATGELREVLDKQITSMLIEFKDRKGVDFPLPTCSESH